jgi:hypothetical protein
LKIAYVCDGEHDFVKFAVLLVVLYGYGWPFVASDKKRAAFLKSLKHYKHAYHGAYIGYLLGYPMVDINLWGKNNNTFGRTIKEANDVAENCEAFVREAIDSNFIQDLSSNAENGALNTASVFPHLW